MIVTDGPVFAVDQGADGETVTGDNGDRIELTCEVDSNPTPNISWYNSDKVRQQSIDTEDK